MNYSISRVGEVEETVTLFTFQHRDTLAIILKDGKYTCERTSEFHKATPLSYEYLCNNLKSLTGEVVTNPIFAWARLLNRPLTLDLETIDRGLQATGVPLNKYYLYVLEVPKSKVFIHDFYNFVDMRCDEEDDELLDDLHKYRISDVSENQLCQAVIPYIELDYVKGVYVIEDLTDYVNVGNSTTGKRNDVGIYNIYYDVFNDKLINTSFKETLNAKEFKASKSLTTENYQDCYNDLMNFIQSNGNMLCIGSSYFRYDNGVSLINYLYDMRRLGKFSDMSFEEFNVFVDRLRV